MRRVHFVPVFFLVLAAAFWSSARGTATQTSTAAYGVSDLGTLGGATSAALGLASGPFPDVVGYSLTAGGVRRGFVGNPFGLHALGTLGGATSEAWAMGAGGMAVGRAQTASGLYHAVSWDYAHRISDLGTLGGSQSYATATNDFNVIVGASLTTGDASTRAFIYQAGAMSELAATLGGPNTVANAINSDGHVVGRADLPGGETHHAFVYANGTTTDLGSLGTTSEAYAINDAGVIAGRSRLADGRFHAFRYAAGVMEDLGTLGGGNSEAHGINSGGVIVGWSETATGARHAFVWRDGVMTDLNELIPPGTGWVLEAASGVGNTGAIAGYGTRNGALRAFLLTPPADLRLDLSVHSNDEGTNYPDPHETGQQITLGASVFTNAPHAITGVTIVDTISGPVEYVGWVGQGECQQDGQRMTCRMHPFEFDADIFFLVRSTGPGPIQHSAEIVAADPPDPNPGNNAGTESNTAVGLSSLTLNPTTVVGGQRSLGRATLTSTSPAGGATVRLTSSRPDIASVPSQFDVLPGSNGGLWREFYVTTQSVTAPITVQISAAYGLVTKVVPLTIVPPGTQYPYGGRARAVPGTIEAEDFDEGGEGVSYHDSGAGNNGGAYRSTDVDLERTTDAGGGVNVGWIAAAEWLEYSVNVATAGTYRLDARVASPGTGGSFHVEVAGANKTGAMSIPNTGGWQAWTTVSRSFALDAGAQILRVSFDTNGSTGAAGNLNYLRLTLVSSGATPYGGTPRAIPGTIQAEDFDEGGEGVAYHDTTAGNTGGQYRTNAGVDIERTGDTGGGYNVGWMAATEWLNYTVSVGSAGTYTLTARVAANGPGGTFHVECNGADVTGPLVIPNTGGWQAWANVTATVTLTAGVQSMRLVADRAGTTGVFGNLNFITLSAAAPPPASEIVLYATDFTRHGAWLLQGDTTAAGGQKALTPDNGAPATPAPLANPADYVEATFTAPAATPYTLWLRIRATGDTKYSESVWVQYSDARASGASVYPIGTTFGLLVNLENCNACGVSGWGWQNRAYWLTQAPTVTFANSGSHVIRIQTREDGAQIDQVILSPARYLNSAPGLLRNDTTIVPK